MTLFMSIAQVGYMTPFDGFSLNSGNTSPRGIAYDTGSQLLVVGDLTDDQIYAYAPGDGERFDDDEFDFISANNNVIAIFLFWWSLCI